MEAFAFMAVPAFIFSIVAFSSLSVLGTRTSKLESKMKKIIKEVKGENMMSQLIKDLVGKKCLIELAGIYLSIGKDKEVEIIEVDDEWVKITYMDKKDSRQTTIVRIEDIKKIDLVNE